MHSSGSKTNLPDPNHDFVLAKYIHELLADSANHLSTVHKHRAVELWIAGPHFE